MKDKKKNSHILYLLIIGGIGIIGGMLIGMMLQQLIIQSSIIEVASALEGSNFELTIDINETLMVDRTMDKMKEFGVFNFTNETGDNLNG